MTVFLAYIESYLLIPSGTPGHPSISHALYVAPGALSVVQTHRSSDSPWFRIMHSPSEGGTRSVDIKLTSFGRRLVDAWMQSFHQSRHFPALCAPATALLRLARSTCLYMSRPGMRDVLKTARWWKDIP